MRRSLVGIGAVAMVAVLAVGAFALTRLDKEVGLPPAGSPKDGDVLGEKELAPEDALMDPPLPVPPSEIDLHTPIDDYEELAQFDAPGVRNLFLKGATLEDVELLRELYMGSMEDAGWTLVREEDQAKKLKTEYAMVQFWKKEDGDTAFSLEQLGFADFLGYENLLKFSYASCPPAELMWCGTDN